MPVAFTCRNRRRRQGCVTDLWHSRQFGRSATAVASTEATWTTLFDASVTFTSAPKRRSLSGSGFIDRSTETCQWGVSKNVPQMALFRNDGKAGRGTVNAAGARVRLRTKRSLALHQWNRALSPVNRSFDGIPQSDFDCASCDSSARSRGSVDNDVDNAFLLAEILDAEISIFVKTVFGLKTDVTARELAGVI